MKTRKTVIAVLTAVLLISATLIVGCMSQFDGISAKDKDAEDDYPIPEGQGRIKFKITTNENNLLTILPDSSSQNVANMYYVFSFENTTTNVVITRPSDGTRLAYSSTGSVTIPEATYNVSVSAYNAATDGLLITGWDSSATATPTYTVDTGASTQTVPVVLTGKCDGSGKGLFKYSIDVPSIVLPTPSLTSVAYIPNGTDPGEDSESMLLEVSTTDDFSSTEFSEVLNVGLNEENDGIQLDSGVYYVRVTLKATNCQNRVMNSVMHIYNGLTSTYTTTLHAPVQNKFTVKFDRTTNISTGGADTTDYPIANAGTTSKPSNPSDSSSTYDFLNWYTAASGGSIFNFSSKIFKDTIIYAQWTPASSGPLNITITFTAINDVAVLTPSGGTGSNSDSISYDDVLSGAQTVTFTVSGIDTNIKWLLDGVDITSSGIVVSGVITLNDTINTTLLDTLASGYHTIDVIGKKSPDTKDYSAHIEFQVTHP